MGQILTYTPYCMYFNGVAPRLMCFCLVVCVKRVSATSNERGDGEQTASGGRRVTAGTCSSRCPSSSCCPSSEIFQRQARITLRKKRAIIRRSGDAS